MKLKEQIEQFLLNNSDRAIYITRNKETKTQREWCESELMELLKEVAVEFKLHDMDEKDDHTIRTFYKRVFDEFIEQFNDSLNT